MPPALFMYKVRSNPATDKGNVKANKAKKKLKKTLVA